MATPVGDAIALTGNDTLDGLIQGGQWQFGGDPRVLTYSFSVETDIHPTPQWTPALRAVVVDAFAQWAAVANISFDEKEDEAGLDVDGSFADIAIAPMGNAIEEVLGLPALAFGFFPDPVAVDEILVGLFGFSDEETFPRPEGDIYLDSFKSPFAFVEVGGSAREVLLHEIGHALGLKHPEDPGANGRPIVDLDPRYTVMSSGAVQLPLSSGHAATPLLYDILAIQHIYGANMTYHAGDDTYFLQLDGAQRAIWDAGGDDTLDASLLPFGLSFTLNEGEVMELTTRTQVAIAFNVTIENAVGTPFDDSITGNAAANFIAGGAGNDRLDGGGGTDTLAGGAGNDTYVLRADSLVVESAGQGTDTVEADVSTVLPDHVEILKATGLDPISLTGNALANLLVGNGADNTLDGGRGADTLAGGGGNDTYLLSDGDVATDSGGTDTALLQRSYGAPPTTVENIALTARAGNASIGASGANHHLIGNDGANRIDGGGGNDTIEGGRGDDTLLGGTGNDRIDGGRGADLMVGGAGNDVYVVGSVRDEIIELAGGGVDTVEIEAPLYALPANVENARLLYDGGSVVTGNSLANRFVFDELGGIDVVIGFTPGVDKIVVDAAVFGTDITYDASTGALYYDDLDIQFAQLGDGALHPALVDIEIV